MKTTLDLPDSLVKKIKLRAVQDGRKLKDTVADLLRKGLAVAKSAEQAVAPAVIVKDKRTGLPVIQCRHPAPPGCELTPERVAEILLSQEIEWQHDSGR